MKLEIKNITKRYHKNAPKTLDDVSAVLTPGVYGLLGPNGAGKSTLVNIITDNVPADGGSIEFDGIDIKSMGREFRAVLGYMPQQQGLYDGYTANQFLWYMAALKGLKKQTAKEKINELFDLVNLRKDAHKKLGSYSGGMKQRALIAQALLNDPKILILDEPTAGLDPKERIRLRNLISRLSEQKIVIIATHIVSDIEYIAKEIILLKGGRIIQKDKAAVLTAGIGDKVWLVKTQDENTVSDLMERYNVANITMENGVHALRVIGDTPPVRDAVNADAELEDVYLYYMGNSDEL